MKIFLAFILIINSTVINAQTIEGNKYFNKEIGISMEVDNGWKMNIENNVLSIVNKTKKEMITLHISKLSNPNTEGFNLLTQKDVDNYKSLLTKKYQTEGHLVKSVQVMTGKFLNYPSLISIAHLSGQPYLNGIPIYKKEILFVIKPYYEIGFIYFIPENISSTSEINKVEKQILSIKKIN